MSMSCLCDWAYKRSRATYRKEKGVVSRSLVSSDDDCMDVKLLLKLKPRAESSLSGIVGTMRTSQRFNSLGPSSRLHTPMTFKNDRESTKPIG